MVAQLLVQTTSARVCALIGRFCHGRDNLQGEKPIDYGLKPMHTPLLKSDSLGTRLDMPTAERHMLDHIILGPARRVLHLLGFIWR